MSNYPSRDWLYNQYVVDEMETTEIGKICGVTYKTVCRWLSEESIPNRRSSITKETYDAIQMEYDIANEEGLSIDLRAMSNKLGHSKTTICRCAKRLGLTENRRSQSIFFKHTNWTEPKIRFLADNFHNMTYPALQAVIGAEESTIRRKLVEYDLEKHESDRWKYRPHPRGMLGKNHTPEFSKRMSQRIKEAWADPHSGLNSDETRQKQSDNMTRFRATTTIQNPYSRTKSGKRADLNNVFFRSAWEANFARYLNLLLKNGDIWKWEFEPDRFEFTAIKRGTRSYLPDFKVWDAPDAEPYYYEVKGWMDAKSKTKLKRMAKYYPAVKVIVFGAKDYNSLRKNLSAVIPHWE